MPATVVVVIMLVALLAGALVVERHLHTRVPREVEQRLHETFGVDARVMMSGRARDWVRQRSVAHVVVDADDVAIQQGRSRVDLHVELADVRIARDGNGRRVVAGSGTFSARLGADALAPLLRLPPLLRRVELRRGRVRLLGAGGLALDMDVTLEGTQVVLRPRTPIPSRLQLIDPVLRFRLDDLPAGAVVTAVRVTPEAVLARGTLDGQRLADAPPTVW